MKVTGDYKSIVCFGGIVGVRTWQEYVQEKERIEDKQNRQGE